MAQHNTHRAAGRAVTPVTNAHTAARGLGGAAVLGTVLVGSAFTGGTAQAAPASPAPAAPAAQTAPAAPVTTAPAAISVNHTLYQGSRGGAVKDLQRALNDNGANLAVDGSFGPATHDAVINYQSSNGLQVDGRVGPETRGSLNGGSSGGSGGGSGSTGNPGSSGSNNGSTSGIVDRARSVVGTPYSWGGSSTSGMDCSGLVSYAYEGSGISVPRTAGQIASAGRTISQSEAQPGDIVSWPGHVGIYAGNGKVIDAGSSKGSVSERSIWGSPSFVTFR